MPPSDIVPFAQLVPDLAVYADGDESRRFMKSDARRIGLGDPRVRIHETLPPQALKESFIQDTGDSLPPVVLAHVDRCLDRPLIRLPKAVAIGVGISGDVVPDLRDEPRVVSERIRDAVPEVVLVGDVYFETRGKGFPREWVREGNLAPAYQRQRIFVCPFVPPCLRAFPSISRPAPQCLA